jgi:hypothetical protein
VDQTSADAARRELTDFTRCAACGTPLASGRCSRCGLDLTGADGVRIAEASRRAAAALDDRHRLIQTVRAAQVPAGVHVPVRPAAPLQPTAFAPPGAPASVAPVAVPAGAVPGGATPPGPVAGVPYPTAAHPGAMSPVGGWLPPGAVPPPGAPWPQPAPQRPFDVARLFALAGAGLVAAAALVFAFFVLDDAPGARVAVLVLATALATAGTLVLRRTGIGSSAEAVGGLVVALSVVDVWVVAELAGDRARWLVLAFLLVALGVGLTAAGIAAGVRSWTLAVLVLPFVPVAVAGWFSSPWGLHLALLAAALVTLVRVPYRRAVDARFGPSNPWTDVLLGLAAVGFLLLALLTTLALPELVPGWSTGSAAVGLLLVAAVAEVHARFGQAATAWTATAGALAVLAAVVAPLGVAPDAATALGVGPLAGAAVWALLALVPPATGRVVGSDLAYRARVSGGWVALVLATLPGTFAGAGATLGLLGGLDGEVPARLDVAAFDWPATGPQVGPVLAAVVLAIALGAVGRLRLAPVVAWVPSGPLPAGPGVPVAFAPALPPVLRAPAVVATGRVCGPAAAVLAVWVATGLLHPWSPALLAAEVLLGAALVETARWSAGRVQAVPVVPPAPGVPPVPAVPAVSPVPGATRPAPWHGTLVVAALLQIVLVTLLGWVSRPTVAIGAVVVVVLLLRARRLVPAEVRVVLTATAAAYAGMVLAVLLAWAGWDAYGVIGGTAVALVVVAAVLTVLPAVGRDSWLAVLAVSLVPAGTGIVAVGVDRTWWSAGVAAALLGLEVVLLGTRTRPVAPWLRVLAAALVVPTVSVVLICAGALLLPGSGSPVLLPAVAVLAAATAIAAPGVADTLRRRLPDVPADQARIALELAAAGTAAVTLVLAVLRDTTGADTVLVLCAVLAAGATAVAQRPDRRPVWWAAAWLWTGVVWSALAWWGVGLVEAYTAPPAVTAVVVGTLLARRGDRWRPLVQAGAALLVAPTLLLAVAGRDVDLRSVALLAFAALAVGIALLADADAVPGAAPGAGPDAAPGARTQRALRALADPLLIAGGAAALAGAVRSAHLAAGTPHGSTAQDARLFAAALAWSLVGAALLGTAGALLARREVVRTGGLPAPLRPLAERRAALVLRWSLAPALVAGTVGTLVAVRSTWAAVWTGWLVELVLLALAVLAVRAEVAAGRGLAGLRSRVATLPPGWFLWLGALAWAIGAWSTRLLRVEVFALPLGLALTAMGFVALRATLADAPVPGMPTAPRGFGSAGSAGWPVGYRGSVATLTPGILATLGPSMLAIWTDPMTWRAILVVVLALGFMMLGARQMLRAPLVVGAVSLGVAVLSVFAAQIDRTISAGPWLLTLLAAGGLLLVLAIFAERRRTGEVDDAAGVRVLR